MRLFCQDVSFKVDGVKAQTIETVLEGAEGPRRGIGEAGRAGAEDQN